MPSISPQHSASAFFTTIRNPVKFRFFLLKQLPAALFSGLKLVEANESKCTVSVPYTWFTRNPFRSTYFACLSMAAEMSTGVLAMAQTLNRQPRIALLVIGVEGKFYKKATGPTRFTCEQGDLIRETVGKAMLTGEAQTIRAASSGYNERNELVAEFWITWSFRKRS